MRHHLLSAVEVDGGRSFSRMRERRERIHHVVAVMLCAAHIADPCSYVYVWSMHIRMCSSRDALRGPHCRSLLLGYVWVWLRMYVLMILAPWVRMHACIHDACMLTLLDTGNGPCVHACTYVRTMRLTVWLCRMPCAHACACAHAHLVVCRVRPPPAARPP